MTCRFFLSYTYFVIISLIWQLTKSFGSFIVILSQTVAELKEKTKKREHGCFHPPHRQRSQPLAAKSKMENHIPDLDEVGCRFHPERHLKDTLEKFK